MDEKEKVEIHERLTKLEGSMKTVFSRVDVIDDKLDSIETKQDIMHEMNTNIKIIAVNQENQNKEIVTIKCDVKELKEKPAKRWDALTTLIITLIVSGIAGFIIGKVFGG
jgi:hypothetical protein